MDLLRIAFVTAAVFIFLFLVMGFMFLIIKLMMRFVDSLESSNGSNGVLKTRLNLTVTLPNGDDVSKPPYKSSTVIVHSKAQFLRMAEYWWDHRIPGCESYDKFEADAQP